MSPWVAFSVITWVAIAVLYFGLAAVMREVRLLRNAVIRDPDGFATAQPDLVLGERFADGGQRIVAAVDSGCPLCLEVAGRLAKRAAGATLLTHEPAATWADVAGTLRIVSDREAWRAVSHLSPPLLMLVDGSGRVRRLLLPVRVDEVDKVLPDWRALVSKEGMSGVADVRADS
ncbi:MAG TPA: hypothetical protein VLJ59_09655 [Mycobacteriales bacterium]|nr:hypothetical protein [Mycobacteriales bacterium]